MCCIGTYAWYRKRHVVRCTHANCSKSPQFDGQGCGSPGGSCARACRRNRARRLYIPQVETVEVIARVLGVTVDSLLSKDATDESGPLPEAPAATGTDDV